MEKVRVKSFGCSANLAEAEIMAGLLKKAEYDIVEQSSDANVIVLNICTVKGNANALREIRKTKEQFPDKKLVVTGCIPQELIEPARRIDSSISFVNTHGIQKIVPALQQAVLEKPVEILASSKETKVNLPRVRKNNVVGIIPICSGCLDMCSFCSTKLVKGWLVSYPITEIIKEVEASVLEGCKEIWLTGQDTGCYGFDLRTNIVKLIEEIVKIKGDFKIRLGMGNPRHLLKYADDLAEVMKHQKMFKFIHLPVQAGNNKVLKAMRRQHSVEDFVKLVEKFRTAVPEITISTDIIVGFPGETAEQFNDTVELIKKTNPDVINLARFVARSGTKAHTFENQISGAEKKERSKIITKLFREIAFENNKKWIGWDGEVIIDERGRNNAMIGRNYCYKPVVLKENVKIGSVVKVKITDASTFCLRGRVV